MKSIYNSIKIIKNIIPYLLLIAIYFFFINLEARNDNEINQKINQKSNILKTTSNIDEKQQRVSIPVVPYQN